MTKENEKKSAGDKTVFNNKGQQEKHSRAIGPRYEVMF